MLPFYGLESTYRLSLTWQAAAGKHLSRGIMRNMKIRVIAVIITTSIMLLAGCQKATPTPETSLFPGEALTPFATSTVTPTATATLQTAPTETLVPTMTSTPVTYTVKGNDTLFSIAAKNGLTLAEIKAANPNVNPYLLGPGTVIVIPAPNGVVAQPTQSAPLSTPYPMDFSDPQCTASLTGGLYCFAELNNPQPLMVDSLSAQFSLTDPATGEVVTQAALVPLNRVASGSKLPLFAYFPPPVAVSPQIGLKLITAMSVNQTGTPSPLQSSVVTVDQSEITISANGLSAVVTTQAKFDSAEGVTGKIWIAAVAYDSMGEIVGIRRFVSTSATNPGEYIPFTLNLYSIGGKIEKVELFGEVNP
jgi:LysM repeat protein